MLFLYFVKEALQEAAATVSHLLCADGQKQWDILIIFCFVFLCKCSKIKQDEDVQWACRASSAFISACFYDNQLNLAAILVACNANQSAQSFLRQVLISARCSRLIWVNTYLTCFWDLCLKRRHAAKHVNMSHGQRYIKHSIFKRRYFIKDWANRPQNFSAHRINI